MISVLRFSLRDTYLPGTTIRPSRHHQSQKRRAWGCRCGSPRQRTHPEDSFRRCTAASFLSKSAGRAEKIGANFSCASVVGDGTKVLVIVPARRAYVRGNGFRLFSPRGGSGVLRPSIRTNDYSEIARYPLETALIARIGDYIVRTARKRVLPSATRS